MAKRDFLPGDARQSERAYSPAVKVSGGTTIYLAGYGAFQDQAGKSYAGDFDAQVRLSFERIRQTLEKAGGKLDDIVTMIVFIIDMANGTRFTQLRRIFPRRPLSSQRADRHQGTGAARDDGRNSGHRRSGLKEAEFCPTLNKSHVPT